MTLAARALLFLLGGMFVVRADVRYVEKYSFGERGESRGVVYMRHGEDSRTEQFGAEPGRVTISSSSKDAMYVLDERAKQYEEHTPDWLFSVAMWMRRPPRVRESGKTVNIYYETVDTGERREMFGMTARHLILRERQVAEAGACGGNSEMEREGWYVSQPSRARGRLSIDGAGRGVLCRDTIVKHGTDADPGFALEESMRRRVEGGRRSFDNSSRSEVVEYSMAPLDPRLFEIPADFHRVASLSGESASQVAWARLVMDWNQLEQAAESWFDELPF